MKRNKKTKVICNADNIIPHEKRWGDNLLTTYMINSVDGFLVMTDAVMHQLDFFDKKKPRKLSPHPVYDHFGDAVMRSEALKYLNIDDDGHFILFFGFIRDYKGLDILLKIMCDERIKNANIRLIVAGEFYNDAKPYLDFIANNNISGKIILRTSFIPDRDVKYYFSAADLVVQPYKTATQSGVTQICYHFNKPMLVTNVGGLPEMVTNNVGYVTSVDDNEITEAILDYFNKSRQQFFSENIKTEKTSSVGVPSKIQLLNYTS